MKAFTIISPLLVICVLYKYNAVAQNLPGPMVYVVTPSPRPPQISEGRSAPFYYHNWMRRMDLGPNTTTTASPTTTSSRVKTPDLIFAEFESDNGMQKSIRKLLEKEHVKIRTSTTSQPIYVPDEEFQPLTQKTNYVLPVSSDDSHEDNEHKQTEYFESYSKVYNNNNNAVPIYVPSSTDSTTTTTVATTSSTHATLSNVENIWHIIDSEKSSHNTGKWEEVPVGTNTEQSLESSTIHKDDPSAAENENDNQNDEVYKNFALPGFTTNHGNGAENESRAIRTETNLRFPYINLKPFQIKNMQKPTQNLLPNSKKTNNLFTNLDNFYDLKHPVRGEAQDVVPMRQPVDRYNPAQPYLPQQNYGGNSKDSNKASAPTKATANLVPPPPPPAPKLTDNDFPDPTSYESFPPYPPPVSDSVPPPPAAPKPSVSAYSPPRPPIDDSDSDSFSSDDNTNGPSMDLGYRYKPPSAPVQPFAPTLPPSMKPFGGYNYNKPPMNSEPSPMTPMDDSPDFQGYQYNKPAALSPPSDEMSPPSYNHHDSPPFHNDNDYPELVFQKHHGDDSKDSDHMKGSDMDTMMPPPSDMKPDHGPPDDDSFPNDFPSDFKYHHDFDDHDFYHHHHPTTTTTTEMPRVNRYSYYYLGKKLYYLPLYFSVYFIVYVGALIIKAVLRHKIVYPNSWRPNDTTAGFFSKRSIESWDLSSENLHEITGKVTHALATAAKIYSDRNNKNK